MEKAKTKTKEKTTKAPKAAGKKIARAPGKNTEAKLFNEYTISKKRSGRYEVTGANGKNVNGPAKAKILVESGAVKALKPKAKTEEATA